MGVSINDVGQDLKVDGWSDDKENEPVEKRKRLSLNKKKPAEQQSFAGRVTSI